MQLIRIKCLPGSSFKLSGSHFKKNIKKIKKVVDIFCPLLYTNSCVTERTQTNPSGCGSAWLEHLVWDQGVAGSNPVTPTCNLDFVFIFQKISTKLLTNDVG